MRILRREEEEEEDEPAPFVTLGAAAYPSEGIGGVSATPRPLRLLFHLNEPLGRTVRICCQGQALVRGSTQPSLPLRAARGSVGDVISGMVNRSSSWAILYDEDLDDIYYS